MLKNLLRDIWSNKSTTTGQDYRPTSTPDLHDEWLDHIIARLFQVLHSFEQDNFDEVRYRGISPNTFYYEAHAAYFSFLLKNSHSFFAARQLLNDETSAVLFDQLLLFRTLGHLHVRLPIDGLKMRAQLEQAALWKIGESSDAGILGSLSLFSIPTSDPPIIVKCWQENAAATFLLQQYYFSRNDASVAPASGDYVIDAGACFGDTALRFAQVVQGNGRVFSFDPLAKHCEIMRDNFHLNPDLAQRISVFQLGLSDHRNEVQSAPPGDVIDPGARITDDTFPTRTIDDLVADGTIPHLDFIKMDIEGSELAALKGAEQSIKRWRPRLALSLYHRPEDLFSIPLWIASLNCGYRFYLDHYSIHHEETVLYASAAD